VNLDARSRPGGAGGHGDIGLGAVVAAEALKSGGRSVGKLGFGPAREHGGHPAAVLAEVRAAYCVYATVDPVEPAVLRPLCDRGLAQAVQLQLGKGEKGVLALSLGDNGGL
jgi:hypothetical protein